MNILLIKKNILFFSKEFINKQLNFRFIKKKTFFNDPTHLLSYDQYDSP